MTVGIAGLGLIGGSFAKAFHEAGETVLAFDRDEAVLEFAMVEGTVSGMLDKKSIAGCDLVLVCITPRDAVAYLREMAPCIGARPVVIDCCGTKRVVCQACFPLAKEFGFTYLGGHPMAGSHKGGYRNARANLYHNAPMVIVPEDFDDITLLERVKALLSPAGFGRLSVTTAEHHDEVIAFTSQMAHVVSNAYVKSPTAQIHKGFSAGSYKDLTRVAWLNPVMWAELFLENKDNLLGELDGLIGHLSEYRRALEAEDRAELTRLLEEGVKCKEEVDGR